MPRLAAGREGLDDDHAATAARTWTRQHAWFVDRCFGRLGLSWARWHGEQLARVRNVCGSVVPCSAGGVCSSWPRMTRPSQSGKSRETDHVLSKLDLRVRTGRLDDDDGRPASSRRPKTCTRTDSCAATKTSERPLLPQIRCGILPELPAGRPNPDHCNGQHGCHRRASQTHPPIGKKNYFLRADAPADACEECQAPPQACALLINRRTDN